MRQVGWLHAAPVPPPRKGVKQPDPVSRLEAMKKRGEYPLLPHNPAPYLTDWLFEIGPGGDAPLAIRHIAADLAAFGIEVLPWEAKTLRRLSSEYLSEKQQARKPDRIAPYSGEIEDIEARRAIVARKLDAAFAGLKKA